MGADFLKNFLYPIDILDNREYNKNRNTRYSRIGGICYAESEI